MCDEFEKGPDTAGVCGAQGSKVCAEVKAENVVYYQYGGWGAYHIELEEMYDYRAVKKVIQIMNPSDVYNP